MNKEISQKSKFYQYLAVDKSWEKNIISSKESNTTQNFVQWGDRNKYPNYLFQLYQEAPTLHSIINGVADYITGNGIENNTTVNIDEELVRDMAMSLAIYGGIALNILRNAYGAIAEIKVLDFKYVRSSKDNKTLYYSEDFGKKGTYNGNYFALPAFDAKENQPSSVFYYKMTKHSTYPQPLWSSVVVDAEVEKSIGVFHLNTIKNGFSANVLISFNDGVPSDDQQEQIETNIREKFTSENNAGSFAVSFADSKEHAPTIAKIDSDSFADRYTTLNKKVQQNLFTAFRCNPNIFGIATENLGFNAEEYEQTFKLFNRFTIKPMQNAIINIFNKIFNVENAVEIMPFTME